MISMMYDEDLMDNTHKRLQWDAEGRPRAGGGGGLIITWHKRSLSTDESSKCIEE